MKEIDIIVGLGFGDETKGATASFLCAQRKVDAVVRFSGGPQTLHHTVLEDGTLHGFSQFGSGTFSEVPTILSRFALVNPLNMIHEARSLESHLGYDPLHSLVMSENSPLITRVHRAANHKREELRGNARHGSCGQGIGETMDYLTQFPEDAPRVHDLLQPDVLIQKVEKYLSWVEERLGALNVDSAQNIVVELMKYIENRSFNIVSDDFISGFISVSQSLVFEGTQGVLLDEWLGFHPHTTWATTTSENAFMLLHEAAVIDKPRVLGITRTYHTRHGYGPFPSEFASDYDWTHSYPELHNSAGQWQGAWRVGNLDLTLLDYAVRATGGIDGLVLSHCDIPVDCVESSDIRIPVRTDHDLDEQEKITHSLERIKGQGAYQKVNGLDDLRAIVSKTVDAPVVIESFGPKINQRHFV